MSKKILALSIAFWFVISTAFAMDSLSGKCILKTDADSKEPTELYSVTKGNIVVSAGVNWRAAEWKKTAGQDSLTIVADAENKSEDPVEVRIYFAFFDKEGNLVCTLNVESTHWPLKPGKKKKLSSYCMLSKEDAAKIENYKSRVVITPANVQEEVEKAPKGS